MNPGPLVSTARQAWVTVKCPGCNEEFSGYVEAWTNKRQLVAKVRLVHRLKSNGEA